MPESSPQEFGPQTPTKEDLKKLSADFADVVKSVGRESPEAVAVLDGWIVAKQLQINESKEDHPEALRSVRFNIGLAVLFHNSDLLSDAEESLTAAWRALDNHKEMLDPKDPIWKEIDIFEADIDYYFQQIDYARRK